MISNKTKVSNFLDQLNEQVLTDRG